MFLRCCSYRRNVEVEKGKRRFEKIVWGREKEVGNQKAEGKGDEIRGWR